MVDPWRGMNQGVQNLGQLAQFDQQRKQNLQRSQLAQENQRMQQQRMLMQKKQAAEQKKNYEFQQKLKAVELATRQPDTESARRVYKSLTGDDGLDITIGGEDITFEIVGPNKSRYSTTMTTKEWERDGGEILKQLTPTEFSSTMVKMGHGFKLVKEAKEPKEPTISELRVRAAKGGDGSEIAKQIINTIDEEAVVLTREKAGASAEGKMDGLLEKANVKQLAATILAGRETIENVPNPFGIPLRPAVRAEVLKLDKDFNFLVPRASVKGLTSSIAFQEKQHGAMGNFIINLHSQVDKIEDIGNRIVKRFGVKALDVPRRELLTRFIGSGDEKVIEAYLTEISNEVGKLSTSSQASIRELSDSAQQKWAKNSRPNLIIHRAYEGYRSD